METITTIAAIREYLRARPGARVALVPTMGALHEGHLALMREARRRAEVAVTSIFVNPTQFGPGEDYQRYPRDIEGDSRKCASAGVDAIFAPAASALYPDGFATKVTVSKVTEGLCGASRPVHFAGVATVVTKLLNIVQPDVAIFGEKDFQQLVTIRRLVRDLDIEVEIVGHPTVREPDGLAMSSRNAYLSPEERALAPRLFGGLKAVRAAFRAGERRAEHLAQILRVEIDEIPSFNVEYAEIREADSLDQVPSPVDPVALVAGRFRATRLIDNIRLAAPGEA